MTFLEGILMEKTIFVFLHLPFFFFSFLKKKEKGKNTL